MITTGIYKLSWWHQVMETRPQYCPFVRGIHWWLFTKESVRWSINVSFACTRCWTQSPTASFLRRPDTHVMSLQWCFSMVNWRVVWMVPELCRGLSLWHFSMLPINKYLSAWWSFHYNVVVWCGEEWMLKHAYVSGNIYKWGEPSNILCKMDEILKRYVRHILTFTI